jgi:hypothetical protein
MGLGKTTVKSGRRAIAGLFVLAVMVGSSSSAHAGWFKNFVSRIVNPLNVTSTILGLPIPSNNVIFLAMSSLGILTGCSTSHVDSIPSQCLDSGERDRLNAAINILKTRQYLIDRNGVIDPYTHFRSHTATLINWDNALVKATYLVGYAVGCNGNNVVGCHVVDGTTFLTAQGLASDPAYLAGILLHEADHYNKTHDCGDSADNDANGPYGLEAKYGMSVYLNPPPGVTSGQRAIVQSRAVAIANNQLCNNAEARAQILNYTNAPWLFVGNQAPALTIVQRGQPFPATNLAADQSLQAATARLVFQSDGNLVVYDNQNQPLWASNTSGRACSVGCLASFQSAGNLVLYQNGVAYWASSGYTAPNASLLINDKAPFLEIRQQNKELVWTTNSELMFGRLEYIVTAPNVRNSANAMIAFQADGNLIVYDPSWTPIWTSGTAGRNCGNQNCRAQFQEDGNLVLYENVSGNWYPYWASNTVGMSTMVVTSDPEYPLTFQ